MAKRVLVYSDDLLASSKLLPVIRDLGGAGQMVAQMTALQQQLALGDVAAIIIDLNRLSGDTPAIVAAAQATMIPPAVLAFGSHVHESKLQAAQAAGCTAVYTSGQMHGQTAAILRTYLA